MGPFLGLEVNMAGEFILSCDFSVSSFGGEIIANGGECYRSSRIGFNYSASITGGQVLVSMVCLERIAV